MRRKKVMRSRRKNSYTLALAGFTAAAAALASLTAPALAEPATTPATGPTTQQLLEKIERLQAQLDRLEAHDPARQQADSSHVDQVVNDVLRDASRRGQLIDVEGFTAGYSDGKFLVRS